MTTRPRAIRHLTPPPGPEVYEAAERQASTEVTAALMRLEALLEADPFGEDTYSDDTPDPLLTVLNDLADRTGVRVVERRPREVPESIHSAMHRLVLGAGDLRQQNNMERALSRWLGWNPAAFHPSTEDPTLAGGRRRFRSQIGDPRTPSTTALRQHVQDAYAHVLEFPAAPDAWRALGAALDELATRLAEGATMRRTRSATPEPIPGAPADAAPLLHDGGEPPPPEGTPEAITRRANLTVRPTVERLTRTLALAPGAPSAAVCA